MKDIFEKFIEINNESTALIDSSYKNLITQGITKENPKFNENNKLLQTNNKLATYGDVVIKLAFCEFFLKKKKFHKKISLWIE